jgi:hypothetical protein
VNISQASVKIGCVRKIIFPQIMTVDPGKNKIHQSMWFYPASGLNPVI